MDHHSPKYTPIICHLRDPAHFLLVPTFNPGRSADLFLEVFIVSSFIFKLDSFSTEALAQKQSLVEDFFNCSSKTGLASLYNESFTTHSLLENDNFQKHLI